MTTDSTATDETDKIIALPLAEVVDGDTLRFVRTYATTPAGLWELLTTPAGWAWCRAMEADLKPGGAFVLQFDETDSMEGTIIELEPERRLVLRWLEVGREPGAEPVYRADSVLRLELEPVPGGTQLTLLHQHLDAESAIGFGAGWHSILGKLAAVVDGEPWNDTSLFAAVLPLYQDLIARTFPPEP